jgi:Ca-activated chloride channel family protein
VVTVPTVLIVDASGSMTTADAPGPRIDAARNATRGLVQKLPDDATVGLTTYGTGTGSSDAEKDAGCQDVTTPIPLGRLNRGAMMRQIAALKPSGYTPISLALQRAADQLPADGSSQAIVLVSDGEDTCGTPPCDTATTLKQTHPGLNISTVGFKTEGLASEQLACIAKVTGGLFVAAGNADQLAARLIAVQNVDEAKKSLTSVGIDDIELGQTLDDIRKTHPDFPDGSRTGKVVVVYVDCDFGFVDGVLDSITPHDGGRTIDGVTAKTDMARVSELYGGPVAVDRDRHVVVYRADPSNKESAAAYRIEVDQFSQNGDQITGFVKSIVLCRCAPHTTGTWPEPVVIVTPTAVGAARLGMTDAEIEAAAHVQLQMSCTMCDIPPTAVLPPDYPRYESHTVNNSDPTYAYRYLSVSLDPGQPPLGQVVMTAEGFHLGDTVDELRRIYGDRIRPYEALGLNSVRGYVLAGDGGYIVFNAIDRSGVAIHEFIITPKIFA